MLGSQDQLKYFDSNGKGFDEFTGWYLCDGRNGAPNLIDRLAYGGNSNDLIGTHGGNNRIQLNVDHMPSHSHTGDFNLFFFKHFYTNSIQFYLLFRSRS